MEILESASTLKNRKKYVCQNCDYSTVNKFDFEKHCETIKHKNMTISANFCDLETKIAENRNHHRQTN
jgi:hypothetical protein